MNQSFRSLLINVGVTFVTLLLVAVFFEFVVFHYILPAADLPTVDGGGVVVKYVPNQSGTYRLQDEIRADYSINAQGWNSGKANYRQEKSGPRIAIIGDSYVEALQVATDASLAGRLETLGEGAFEVYRFGMSGAPLSQYLHMLRHEVLDYHPDLVVFNVVHNDIDESWAFMPGVYTSSFLKLKMEGNAVVGEIPPVPFKSGWINLIRSSNTWRYLGVRRQIRFQAVRDMLLGGKDAPANLQANIDVSAIDTKTSRNEAATFYILQQARDLCRENGIRLAVVVDGVRQLVYQNPAGPYDMTAGALKINAMVDAACEQLGIPCVDLHPVFAAHFREHGERFEFKHDGHWNALGHDVAAHAIAKRLRMNPLSMQ